MIKEKEGVYVNYFEMNDCEDLDQGEICPFHKRIAELDLKIIKDVEVSYHLANSKDHKTEHITLKDFQYRLLNDKKLLRVFFVSLEGEDYEIRQIGPQAWVRSFDKEKADSIFKILTD